MAILRHEIWKEEDGCTVCLAGPMGDSARSLLDDGAELVWSFEAGSHVEAMSKYYAHQGWGEYAPDFPQDHDPYPEAWAEVQRAAAGGAREDQGGPRGEPA